MLVQQAQPNEPKVQTTLSEPPSPTKGSEIVWRVTPLSGFTRVTACLWRDQLLEKVCKVPQDPLRMVAVLVPTVASMSTSCIIKDEATGVTYMDTMATSVGRVTLSVPKQGASTQGPIIEDIMDLM